MENYDLIKLVGKGAYGDVNLVSRQGDPKLYVMKVVSNTTAEDESSSVEAMREVNIMRKFRHPNIVEFRECFSHNNGKNLCIVMGYCECGDLSQQIQSAKKRRKYLRESDIMDWVVQLCLALKYLHGHHVLHRDLKPQNVFLTNQYKILKLGDFGITKVLDSTMAQAVTTIGTPYYFSPEICQSRPYGIKSDVWAAGCIVYELMVLQVPFMASNLRALVQKILFSKPASPNTNLYSKDILTLIAAMLAKGPERRPDIKKVLATPCVRAHLEGFVRRYAGLYEGMDVVPAAGGAGAAAAAVADGGDGGGGGGGAAAAAAEDERAEAERARAARDRLAQARPRRVQVQDPEDSGMRRQLSVVDEAAESTRAPDPTAANSVDAENVRLISAARQAHDAQRQSEEREDVGDLVGLATRELALGPAEPLGERDLGETDGYDKKIARPPKDEEKPSNAAPRRRAAGTGGKEDKVHKSELGEFGKSLLKSIGGSNRADGLPMPMPGAEAKHNGRDQLGSAKGPGGPLRGRRNVGVDMLAAAENAVAGAGGGRRPVRPPEGARGAASPRHRSLSRERGQREREDLGRAGKELLRLSREVSAGGGGGGGGGPGAAADEGGAAARLLRRESDFELGLDVRAARKVKAREQGLARRPSFDLGPTGGGGSRPGTPGRGRPAARSPAVGNPRPSSANRLRLASIDRK